MEKQKRDLILAVVLVAIFLAIAGRNFIFKKKIQAPGAPIAGAQTDALDSFSVLKWIRENQSLLDDQASQWGREWGRDPFVQTGSETGALGSVPLSLTGILWDEKMPMAMVNDKILKQGDMIEGYQVVQIKPSSVVFSLGEEKSELLLFQAGSKPTKKPSDL